MQLHLIQARNKTNLGIRKRKPTAKTEIGQLASLATFSFTHPDNDWDYRHLIITDSSEKIKENDLILFHTIHGYVIHKVFGFDDENRYVVNEYDMNCDIRDCIKIIASNHKEITPNYCIQEHDRDFIIRYYNEFGYLPEGSIGKYRTSDFLGQIMVLRENEIMLSWQSQSNFQKAIQNIVVEIGL